MMAGQALPAGKRDVLGCPFACAGWLQEGQVYRVALAAAAFLAALWSSQPANAVEAYVFRGAGDFSFIADGLNFSTGMDRLGRELNDSGIYSKVYRWEAGEIAYREIMRRHPESVALMGHSMGALTSLALAKRLQGSGIRVAYLGLIDIPGPGGIVPGNVEWAENFYHAFPVFGQLTKGPGYKGFISNRYVFGQVHITMDKAKLVHNAMISAIWQADAREHASRLRAYAEDQPRNKTIEKVEKVLASSDERNKIDPVTTAAVSTSNAGLAPRRSTKSGLPPIE
jgi:pimeloyl-ACP methyl ester carboxylesterase